MPAKKQRTDIPRPIAARALFDQDRTCCVCRERGKPVQLHHIDGDPSNHDLRNLAVLCFDCHRNTQITGGFDRKLDAEQVTLYRDDWKRAVALLRASDEALTEHDADGRAAQLELATSIAEIYRENREYELLAIHYDGIGNNELRDKYVEEALRADSSPSNVCFLRCLQGRPDLIPEKIVIQELAIHEQHKAWNQRARVLVKLGRYREAIADYIRGIGDSLAADEPFSAAFYLRELQEERLLAELQILALNKARQENDFWWQVRALQELGWDDELKELLITNAESIKAEGDPMLLLLLAEATDNRDDAISLRKDLARTTTARPLEDRS